MEIAIEILQEELLEERNKNILLFTENYKLIKQNFNLNSELKLIKSELEIKKEKLKYTIEDKYILQDRIKELNGELKQSLEDIKYIYNLKYPNIWEIIGERIKNAYNYIKRSFETVWENRLFFIREN